MKKKRYVLLGIIIFLIGMLSFYSTHNVFIAGAFFLAASIIGITNIWSKK